MAGRVKFRSVYIFRVHHPAFVEGLPPGPIGPAANLYQSEDTSATRSPIPRPRAARSPDRTGAGGALPGLSKRSTVKPGGRQHRGLEILARGQTLDQRGRGAARIPAGQLGHGREGEGVGGVGVDGRARRAPSRPGTPGRRPRTTARLSSSTPKRSHSPAAHAGVALVEPEWYPHAHRLVQSQMGQLVAEGAERSPRVGPEHDRAAPGARPPRPMRALAPGERSSRRPSGTTIRRSGPGARRRGQATRRADRASASSMARVSCSGHATAVT